MQQHGTLAGIKGSLERAFETAKFGNRRSSVYSQIVTFSLNFFLVPKVFLDHSSNCDYRIYSAPIPNRVDLIRYLVSCDVCFTFYKWFQRPDRARILERKMWKQTLERLYLNFRGKICFPILPIPFHPIPFMVIYHTISIPLFLYCFPSAVYSCIHLYLSFPWIIYYLYLYLYQYLSLSLSLLCRSHPLHPSFLPL